ncbi:MAG: glutaminyl-peptide cyclotransferase [Cyclobacteriaceae bacterium]|nr:glutaminyl-peptide cyclotransferase [Cyclobacteriaceae bacterium]UYN86569.1 MAG: glutaminyl-peptide cyclotransferase [Cyclobacteriaceae bacterium]
MLSRIFSTRRVKGQWYRVPVIFLIALLVPACSSRKEATTDTNNTIPYLIFKIFPHDTDAFTQGLVVANGKLIESTGQHGTSWIAEVEISTGKQNKKVLLDKEYFGEGVTVLNNKVYQLTWKNKKGFIYDFKTYEKLGEFTYDSEGWGITHDHVNLIMSDGSDKLYFLDTLSLKPVRTVTVTENGKPVKNLNELEYIEGYVYANLWQTNYIVRIDPVTGNVLGRLDLTKVAEAVYPGNPNADVLNGIAYEPKSKMILITGKLWPNMVAIKFKEGN